MSTVNIEKALIAGAQEFLENASSIDTAAGTVSGLPTLPDDSIGWENSLFEPAEKDPWAAVFFVPNDPEGRTVGQRGYDQQTGFLQIDFNVAPDSGNAVHLSWEDKARIFFHAGRVFSYGGQSVLVVSVGMSQGRHVENFYRKSLTVTFRGQIKRREVV